MQNARRDISISVQTGPLTDAKDATLVVPVAADTKTPRGALRAIDRLTGGAIGRALAGGAFSGKAGESAAFYPESAGRLKRIVLLGIGKADDLDLEKIRAYASTGIRRAGGDRRVTIAVPDRKRTTAAERVRAAAEGAVLGAYRFDRYRTKPEESRLTGVTLLAPKADSGLREAARVGRAVASAANFARDLANTPAADMPPAEMASEARKMSRTRELRCRILTPTQLEKMGMRALLAVGRGSANPPRLIEIEHDPGKRAKGTVILVGKGITFDTGGISLKPWSGMWDMKFDMSGAAAVLGAVRAACDLKLPLRVIALAPCAENMPSHNAYLPGDVLKTYSGKTVEVHSTDAEGRLVLADALHYATRLGADAIVDVATLTGACVIALGHHAAGLFTPDAKLRDGLVDAGEASGERVWPMPVLEPYRRQLDSTIADMKNVGGRPAGAITAAMFLREFVADIPWAHLDIAGVSDSDSSQGYHTPGSTGFGVRLLTRYLEERSQRE